MKKIGKVFFIIVLLGMLIQICICAYYYFSTKDLFDAIESEDVLKVAQLLENGANPNMADVPPSVLWTFLERSPNLPLSIACKTGNLEIVKLLVTYGATVETSTELGFTALQATLLYYQPDDVEIVAFLLKNGVKTEYDMSERAAITAARMFPCVYDKTKSNGTVFSSGYDEPTAMGITKIVEMLLDGKDVDGETGRALLVASIQRENLFLTRYLLSIGCDPSIPDSSGRKPIDYAEETQNDELISILRDGG